MTALTPSQRPSPAVATEVIGRPSPLEGIGGALRSAFMVQRSDPLPGEFSRMLDRLR